MHGEYKGIRGNWEVKGTKTESDKNKNIYIVTIPSETTDPGRDNDM